ncbi:MAG: hypothetical protein AB1757_02305 [Acidobacteriota bacterium]
MKRCSTCKIEKSLDEFGWKNKGKTKRRSVCRECMRIFIKNHYYKNISYYIEKAKRQTQATRKKNYEKLLAYLLSPPCVDCGETDPIVLEFDHLQKESKLSEVSRLISDLRPWRIIEVEINKREVRCANCHRRKTAIEQNWNLYRLTRKIPIFSE